MTGARFRGLLVRGHWLLVPLLACTASATTEACTVPVAGEERSANLEAGRRAFLKCRACHTLGEGERHLVGPNLWHMFRRPAGSAAGFSYSPAIRPELGPWTNDSLDRFLAQPSKTLPGNRMVFAGLSNPTERAHVIVYLRQHTGDPQPGCQP